MDVVTFLKTKDAVKRHDMHAIAKAATEIRRREYEQLSVLILNGIGKMFGS